MSAILVNQSIQNFITLHEISVIKLPQEVTEADSYFVLMKKEILLVKNITSFGICIGSPWIIPINRSGWNPSKTDFGFKIRSDCIKLFRTTLTDFDAIRCRLTLNINLLFKLITHG